MKYTKQDYESMSIDQVLDLLNSIAAKDAEIERLRAAAKPKAKGHYIGVHNDTTSYFVQDNGGNCVAKFRDKSEAESYVRNHQPKPVLRWVSRDLKPPRYERIEVWKTKPKLVEPQCSWEGYGFGYLYCMDRSEAELIGLPFISPGECHCYSVLDGVWTRVEEQK